MLRNLSSLSKMLRNLSTLGKPGQVPPPRRRQGQVPLWQRPGSYFADKPLLKHGLYATGVVSALYWLFLPAVAKLHDWEASTLTKLLKDAEAQLEQLKKTELLEQLEKTEQCRQMSAHWCMAFIRDKHMVDASNQSKALPSAHST